MLVKDRDVFFNKALDDIHKSPVISYDLETTGLSPYQGDRLIGIGVTVPDLEEGKKHRSYYIPFRHANGVNLPIELLYHFAPIVGDPNKILTGFNVGFDVHFTEVERMPVHSQLVDVQLGAHLANENEMSFKLEDLAKKYVDPKADEAEEELISKIRAVVGKKPARKTIKKFMYLLDPEDVAPYANQDTELTWALAEFYQYALEQQGLSEIWYEVNEYLKTVIAMERRGVLIDVENCQRFIEATEKRSQDLMDKMIELNGGQEFNPRSVPQLRKILKQHNTDKESLKTCKHPIAKHLYEFRAWKRAIDTYYQNFMDLMDDNRRVHPNLNPRGTVTGRLSCTNPPLQGLPKKKDQYRVRDLIVAPPGYVLMAWDYSQAEMRMLAHYTNDPFLIDAYINEKDIHGETAEAINIDREKAKRTNFSIVYGIGVPGLSGELKISEKEARSILNRYHKRIPGIKQLYYSAEKMARQKRYIEMWTGRRRHYRKDDFFHKAMSNLIQGGVAEVMRHTITKLFSQMVGTRAYMNLQVHDEILFEIPEDEQGFWAPLIKRTMEDFSFRVPMIAEGKVGKNWANMEPIEVEE